MDTAAIGTHIVTKQTGIGFMDVPVQADLKSGLSQALHESEVFNAVLFRTIQRMVPYSEFEASFKYRVVSKPIQGKSNRIGVDGNPAF